MQSDELDDIFAIVADYIEESEFFKTYMKILGPKGYIRLYDAEN